MKSSDAPSAEAMVTIAKPRLLFLFSEERYFRWHWLNLVRTARDAGYEVIVATSLQSRGDWIKQEGFKLYPLQLQRGRHNPLRELAALIQLMHLYTREQPDIVHNVTMKHVLYGSLSAHLTGVPAVVNTITGLGYVFIPNGLSVAVLHAVIRLVLRWVLARLRCRVIFENGQDLDQLVREDVIQPHQAVIIRGGVDVSKFTPQPESPCTPVVILASRMLWDKGVGEFVEAARVLKQRGICGRFVLVGEQDELNPTSIPEGQLRRWNEEGIVEWWGPRDDMPQVLASSHVVVLPSYREGVPRILLEAAACARPMVATDVPGCREVVRHGENGLLVPARDSQALAHAMAMLIEDPSLRIRMGACGREIAVREFSMEQSVQKILAVYRELLRDR